MNSLNGRSLAILLLGLALIAIPTHRALAVIPDANLAANANTLGFGVFSGAWGRAGFGMSDRSAIGMYAGVDPNDVYFADFDRGDNRFDSDVLVGGHYLYQFVEGVEGNPSVSGIFGAFANRAGLRPELGLALSYPFADRWTGRVNAVYGPSWGLEVGYHFSPQIEGTFGVTGMGMVGINARF